MILDGWFGLAGWLGGVELASIESVDSLIPQQLT
jgi:hypothetical protein